MKSRKQNNWKRAYRRRMLKHALQAGKWWPEEKKHFQERCSDHVFDFFLCCLFLGITANDWFSFRFYQHGWSYRCKHIGCQRQYFISHYLNEKKDHRYLDNKMLFAQKWEDFFKRKWCRIRPEDPISEAEFVSLFQDVPSLICKPNSGAGGRNIRVFETNDLHSLYRQFVQQKDQLIVEEYIHQDGILHELNPSSLNTLRVCTLRDESEVHVLFTQLRIGAPGSFVDNAHSGGTLILIDPHNGRAVATSDYKGRSLETLPNLNIPVTDFVVPRFAEALEWCRKAHLAGPEGLHLIGWDLCICDHDFYMIEGNRIPAFAPPYHDDPWGNMKKHLDHYDDLCNGKR